MHKVDAVTLEIPRTNAKKVFFIPKQTTEENDPDTLQLLDESNKDWADPWRKKIIEAKQTVSCVETNIQEEKK